MVEKNGLHRIWGYTDVLNSIYFVNNDTGWVVGYRSWSPAPIFKTTNGGNSWFEQTSGTYGELGSVHFIDSNIGWAAGAGLNNISSYGGYILNTTNGGINWITQVITKPSGLVSNNSLTKEWYGLLDR